ncbi:hypothetical protein CBL_09481 [Carabus blaptoides fortunei]
MKWHAIRDSTISQIVGHCGLIGRKPVCPPHVNCETTNGQTPQHTAVSISILFVLHPFTSPRSNHVQPYTSPTLPRPAATAADASAVLCPSGELMCVRNPPPAQNCLSPQS